MSLPTCQHLLCFDTWLIWQVVYLAHKNETQIQAKNSSFCFSVLISTPFKIAFLLFNYKNPYNFPVKYNRPCWIHQLKLCCWKVTSPVK